MNWAIEYSAGEWWVEGEVDSDNVDAFCFHLAKCLQSKPSRRLQLLDVDIIDGVAMAKIVSLLRKYTPIDLVFAPQMLAHTCYKCNLLQPDLIRLEKPREG